MKKQRTKVATLAATLITIGSLAGGANAAILWQWSFLGEAGTLLTDGTLVGSSAEAGTYNVIDFSITQTATTIPLGSISGGQWNEGSQPGTGFVWDGSIDTEWFRDGGNFTNGAGYFPETVIFPTVGFERIAFSPGNYTIDNLFTNTNLASSNTLTLVPVTVPEPSSALLLGLGALGVISRRRRI